ncbi:hypothetical protein TNCV_1388391 [Trichonephila clavipes]|nr:hypothetical protein TNCV_1388391 [Trichonephila clavipes]
MKKITREYVEVFVNASKTVNEDLEVTDSQTESGCCTLVVRITDSCLAFHEFGTGTTENQPCKSAVALNLSRLKDSRWRGVEVRRRCVNLTTKLLRPLD